MAENYKYLDFGGLQKYDELIKGWVDNKVGGVDANFVKSVSLTDGADKKVLFTQNGEDARDVATSIAIASNGTKIQLLVGGEVFSEIDESAFVKDGLLEDVDLITIPTGDAGDDANPAGTYLKFIFNTDAGKTPIYVNVTSLLDNINPDFSIAASGDDYVALSGTFVETTPNVWALTLTAGATNKIKNSIAAIEEAGAADADGKYHIIKSVNGKAAIATTDEGGIVVNNDIVIDAKDIKVAEEGNMYDENSYETIQEALDGIYDTVAAIEVYATGDDYVAAEATGHSVTVTTSKKVKDVADAYADGTIAKVADIHTHEAITTAEIESLFA